MECPNDDQSTTALYRVIGKRHYNMSEGEIKVKYNSYGILCHQHIRINTIRVYKNYVRFCKLVKKIQKMAKTAKNDNFRTNFDC